MRRSLRFLVPVFLLALVTAACSSAKPPAATVDGSVISDDQLAQDVVFFRFLAGLSQQTCGGTPTAGETADAACARFTLSNLIQEDLVKGYAQSHDVTVPQTSVTNALAQLEANLGGAKQLDTQLKAAGMTRGDLTSLARRLLLFNEVQKAVAADQVTQAQLQQLYQQQLASFTQLDVKHILVKTQAEAKRIEQQVTPKIFGELAKKYSTDTASAQNGGDLGTISLSTFEQSYDPDFVQATLKLQPGQISPPVKSQFGWHVIELVSRTLQPLSQVRDQLIGPLQGQIFTQWLQQRLVNADISVNPKYGRLDRTNGQVVPVRSTATDSQAPAPSATASATP
ncbi:MAG TPA: peptidylprolyl isomerase [Actinomycetota bacterium]